MIRAIVIFPLVFFALAFAIGAFGGWLGSVEVLVLLLVSIALTVLTLRGTRLRQRRL